jgi:glycerate kinase
VVTAEGSIDSQTPLDKIQAEVALRAERLGVPVFVLAGSIGPGAEINHQYGVDAMFSILTRPCTLEDALSCTGPRPPWSR